MGKKMNIKIPGKYTDIEEEILLYLYNHPDGQHSALSIANDLDDNSRPRAEFVAEMLSRTSVLGKPESFDPETVRVTRRPTEVQSAIESLIINRLVKGRPTGKSGSITHHRIKLTEKGQREALIAKNRSVREIVVEFVQPAAQPDRPPLVPAFDE